jgi:hypothetical protein
MLLNVTSSKLKKSNRSSTPLVGLLAPLLLLLPLVVLLSLSTPASGQDLVLDGGRFLSTLESTFMVTDSSTQCSVQSGCLPYDTLDRRRVIRGDIVIANVGNAASQLQVSSNAFFNATPCDGPQISGVLGLITISLMDASGVITFTSVQRAVCLYDQALSPLYTGNAAPAAPVYSCNTPMNSKIYQGLSAGYQVAYTKDLDCFALDVTDYPPNSYTVRVTVNNPVRFPDLNVSNNQISVPFTLTQMECPPAPRYNNVTWSTLQSWTDPIANGHQRLVNSTIINFSSPIKYFCSSTSSLYLSFNGFVSYSQFQNDGGVGPMPSNLIDLMIAPYWSQWQTSIVNGNSGLYYDISGSVGSRLLLVTWYALVNQGKQNQNETSTWQLAYWEATQKLEFRYVQVVYQDENTYYGQGADELIAFTGPAHTSYSSHTNVILSTTFTSTLTDNTLITLTPQQVRGGATLPVANPGGPYSGFTQFAYQMTAVGSIPPMVGSQPLTTNLSYIWTTGEGLYPALSLGINVTHNFTAAGTYPVSLRVVTSDGLFESNTASTSVTAIQAGDGGTPLPPQGSSSDSHTTAIVVGVVIPVVVLLMLAMCATAFIVLYKTRGIVPSGGDWWNQDPEYVNLPHTWNVPPAAEEGAKE